MDALCGCSVSIGDSNATLAGRENVCIIGLTGRLVPLCSIMQTLSNTPKFKSVCANNLLIFNGANEPLVSNGRLTTWAKGAFDSLKKNAQLQPPTPPKKVETPKPAEAEKHATQSTYSLYTDTGVCDVCNNSLNGRKAYVVPKNHVFYNSNKYISHVKNNPMLQLMGIPINDAYFAQMQARDSSAGSAVCENGIYMF